MSEKNVPLTALAKANDLYLPMIEHQLMNNGIDFNDYSRKCVMNAVSEIYQLLEKQSIPFDSPDLNQSNISNILANVAHLELNPLAQPSECYFIIRKVKRGDVYKKMIEMGIEGDGNDAILARFGRNVKKVYPHWIVREDDYFEYPKFNGLEMMPPKWEPRGTGDVVRIVYPILHDDNTIHYYIGEREDVKRNLLAHINNNLMNETFGLAESTYKATPEQLSKIAAKKAEIKKKAKEKGFDAIYDPEISEYISPAWKEDFSNESMIIRKIRNNIVTKIPKDFSSPFVKESFDEVTMTGYSSAKTEIENRTAIIDVEPINSPEPDEIVPEGSGDKKAEGNPSEDVPEARIENVDARAKPNFD